MEIKIFIGILLAVIGGLGIGFGGWKNVIFFYLWLIGFYLLGGINF